MLGGDASQENLARLSQALTDLGARSRTEAVPDGLPFSHDATSLAAAEVWNLVCADGEFAISFHPSGFAGGYAQLAVNAHRLRVGDVEVVVADLADVIQSKESAGRPKALRVLPLLYRHLSARRPQARIRTGVNHPAPRLLPPAEDELEPKARYAVKEMMPRFGKTGGASDIPAWGEYRKRLSLAGLEDKITCPILNISTTGEGKLFYDNAKALFDHLPNPNNRFVLTTEDDGGEMHCVRGNSSLMHQIIFDWLDEVLTATSANTR